MTPQGLLPRGAASRGSHATQMRQGGRKGRIINGFLRILIQRSYTRPHFISQGQLHSRLI